MTGLADLVWLRPWWLLGLPLAVGLAWSRLRSVRRASAWSDAVDPVLLAALERFGRIGAGPARGRRVVPVAAILAGLVAVALAGPALESRDTASFRNLDGVVLAVDLGPADPTRGADPLPDSLVAARLVAEAAGTRPVALVVYAGDAYEASNFTTDAPVLGTTLAVLDRETVPDAGRRPDLALELADRITREAGLVFSDVVLIGSGRGIGPAAVEAARGLAGSGRRISVVTDGPDGAAELAALARIGGGAVADIADPAPVMETVAAWRRAGLARDALAALVWTDYGRALLVLALVPAFMLFRRRA